MTRKSQLAILVALSVVGSMLTGTVAMASSTLHSGYSATSLTCHKVLVYSGRQPIYINKCY